MKYTELAKSLPLEHKWYWDRRYTEAQQVAAAAEVETGLGLGLRLGLSLGRLLNAEHVKPE
jgi:hypothetical protein